MSTGYEWRAKCVPNVWHQDGTKLPFATRDKAAADAVRHAWGPDKFDVREVPRSLASSPFRHPATPLPDSEFCYGCGERNGGPPGEDPEIDGACRGDHTSKQA